MKAALGIALLAASGASASTLFDDGNTAYLAGDNARAVSAYEALVAEGVRSPELETNLGAAHLRQNHRGRHTQPMLRRGSRRE